MFTQWLPIYRFVLQIEYRSGHLLWKENARQVPAAICIFRRIDWLFLCFFFELNRSNTVRLRAGVIIIILALHIIHFEKSVCWVGKAECKQKAKEGSRTIKLSHIHVQRIFRSSIKLRQFAYRLFWKLISMFRHEVLRRIICSTSDTGLHFIVYIQSSKYLTIRFLNHTMCPDYTTKRFSYLCAIAQNFLFKEESAANLNISNVTRERANVVKRKQKKKERKFNAFRLNSNSARKKNLIVIWINCSFEFGLFFFFYFSSLNMHSVYSVLCTVEWTDICS